MPSPPPPAGHTAPGWTWLRTEGCGAGDGTWSSQQHLAALFSWLSRDEGFCGGGGPVGTDPRNGTDPVVCPMGVGGGDPTWQHQLPKQLVPPCRCALARVGRFSGGRPREPSARRGGHCKGPPQAAAGVAVLWWHPLRFAALCDPARLASAWVRAPRLGRARPALLAPMVVVAEPHRRPVSRIATASSTRICGGRRRYMPAGHFWPTCALMRRVC